MPQDGQYAFRILVGGHSLPEYAHGEDTYVESNLSTPHSYQQEVTELVNGEKETQSFPVTPYRILLKLGHHCEASAFFIYVDGVQVTKTLLEPGETKLIRGFEERGGTKEFLFALPRFARDKADRINSSLKNEVGTISIVRRRGSYVKEEYRPMSDVQFYQANKKDAYSVTNGRYTMSTTKKGKYLNRTRPYEVRLKKIWQIREEVGRLTLNYRMGHVLEDMGINLEPVDWSAQPNATCRSSSSRTTSSSSESSVTSQGAAQSDCHMEEDNKEHVQILQNKVES